MRREDEFILVLKGLGNDGPESMPLARLAEYMRQFAELLGAPEHMLFSGVRSGSMQIVARTPRIGVPTKAQDRVRHAVSESRDAGAGAALRALAQMAHADRRRGRIMYNRITLAHLPSYEPERVPPLKVRDHGSVTGELASLSRTRDGIKARIRPLDGGTLVACRASERVARELRTFLFEYVRVEGVGWWERHDGAGWRCLELDIQSCRPVDVSPLADAIKKLRSAPIDWPDDPIAEMTAMNE